MREKSDIEIIMGFLSEEVEGVEMYTKEIAMIKNPEGKALLKNIMADEKKHAASLLQLFNKMANSVLA